MKYFIDTEFHEYKKKPLFSKGINTIELISIGIVCEDGRKYYAISKEFDLKLAWGNEWLKENVLKKVHAELLSETKQYKFWGNLGQGRECAERYVDWAYKKRDSRLFKELKGLINKYGKINKDIAEEIQLFTDREVIQDKFGNGYYHWEDKPEFYAYYADYDWVVFCWLFGRMIDLPKGFPMYCIDLKQALDEKLTIYSNKGIDNICDKAGLRNHPKEIFRNELSLEQKIYHVKTYCSKYPKQTNEHNALADAKWNYELYKFLQTI